MPKFRTALHIGALAAATLALFSEIAPAAGPAYNIPSKWLHLMPYPGASEWDCKDQPKTHWCHKPVKKTKAAKRKKKR